MNFDELERLNDLKEKGILTQDEFEIQKRKLLNQDEMHITITPIESKFNWKKIKLRWYFLIFLGLLLFCYYIYYPNYSKNTNTDPFLMENRPNPVVVFKDSNFDKSNLLELTFTIKTKIQNIGNDGYINITSYMIKKSGEKIEKNDRIYLNKNQSIDREYDFPEYESGDGEISYNVLVMPD